ncbi:Lipid II:glycine glycyltransferase (Peptidoglycan interpeptide bridge formation enzyme) [Actinacidiphila paucisporea]|uniref:Lipid II:glycine glycyltransferase (Peptidoglycan interpeptide bridge formation enzyme) n=2 Tax=Actinacidiphila paucisporea TaxID=310782 RepID=A0A1M7QLH9_9ACTN|nr:Lipid II:glycine glycyltransferase (Peptidoglycan interpeptide bridge formation enzyme) [Actinacidiphila paucisporea]
MLQVCGPPGTAAYAEDDALTMTTHQRPQVPAPAGERTELRLGVIPGEVHAAYLRRPGAHPASFLQTPAWARVKTGWRAESLGWFDADRRMVGSALVLYRRLPGVRRFFAYLPEGPGADWADPQLERWLDPLLGHLAATGAFAVRMGPPLAYRRWSARTLKDAAGPGRRVGDILPDMVEPLGAAVADRLRESGWRRCGEDGQGGDAQPRLVFEVPLAGRGLDDLWTGLNQEWRRNVKKASKSGVWTGVEGPRTLPGFHQLLRVTERRDGFALGRDLDYYRRQYAELNAEQPGRMRLYTARHQGELLAAHTLLTAPDGSRVWYQTGASADHRREVRPSNALQWRMLRDALTAGAAVYDMRGVPDDLDPAARAHGLLRWKLGTGGEAVETVGEWELPLQGAVNKALHRAMHTYLTRR